MDKFDLYRDIASRTGGDVYVGVVGPVRTGKSTLIKQVMQQFVVDGIVNADERNRAIDEIPQSADGKTIMTTQPRFVPNEAVRVSSGKAYGELNANNHASLKHIDAKTAAKDTEGNVEYWYCSGCDKYYADADATKEIAKAATVTAKLPDEPRSPQTGDNSSLMLWFALLLVSGGAVIGTAVTEKKKKQK